MTYNASSAAMDRVNWLIGRLMQEVPTIQQAILVSGDGLHLCTAGKLSREQSESASALTAGFVSITREFGRVLALGDAPRNLSMRYPGGHLTFLAIDEPHGEFAAALIVAAAPHTQLQQLAFAMTAFGKAVGHALTPELRHGMHQQTLPAAHR